MSSDSDVPEPAENEVLEPDHFSVTIARDGTTNYEFTDQGAVERFFGTRILTTPDALREVVREISVPARDEKRPTTADRSRLSGPDVKPTARAVAPDMQNGEPIPDDTIVDQRTVRAPRDLYLRLARARAFPSRKEGKRILARWGDVRVALLEGPGARKAIAPPRSPEAEGDGLDALRRQLGLAKKGK